jgi:hypothetical protein
MRLTGQCTGCNINGISGVAATTVDDSDLSIIGGSTGQVHGLDLFTASNGTTIRNTNVTVTSSSGSPQTLGVYTLANTLLMERDTVTLNGFGATVNMGVLYASTTGVATLRDVTSYVNTTTSNGVATAAQFSSPSVTIEGGSYTANASGASGQSIGLFFQSVQFWVARATAIRSTSNFEAFGFTATSNSAAAKSGQLNHSEIVVGGSGAANTINMNISHTAGLNVVSVLATLIAGDHSNIMAGDVVTCVNDYTTGAVIATGPCP